MALYTGSAPLPHHQYAWIQPHCIGTHEWLKVAWFGMTSFTGRIWGCHVLLECGAMYRSIPLHHLAHEKTEASWSAQQAQTWDCYGDQFSIVEYPYLRNHRVRAKLKDRSEHDGKYVLTLIPMLDGYSAYPEQSKEFTLVALRNGRYTCQPTNHILVDDKSFITTVEWPTFLKRQTEVWSAESGDNGEAI